MSSGTPGSSSATITWLTSYGTTSQVNYGLGTSYIWSTLLDGAYVTSHSVTISNLTPGTTYHYQAVSMDLAGRTVSSGDFTFTTAEAAGTNPAPVISNVGSTVSSSGATVTWLTDIAATSQVQYGTTTAYGSSTALDSTLVTSHSVALSGLASGTLYHYRVLSQSSAGTLATSGDYTFTTATAPAPVISNVSTGVPTTSSTTVTWTTDQSSTSQVEYGTTTAYGSVTPLDSTLVTSHSVTVAGLAAGTTYHCRVISQNSARTSSSASGDYTFTTAAASGGSGGSSVLSYASPYCQNGVAYGAAWACGAWPSTTAPSVGAPNTATKDPDTGNRVLRVTSSGNYGQTSTASFFTNYSGWDANWAADDSALIVRSYDGDGGKFWIGFDPVNMQLTGQSGRIPDAFDGDYFMFDDNDPNLVIGIQGSVIRSWNRSSNATSNIYALSSFTNPFTLTARSTRLCAAQGNQDNGHLIECFDRASGTVQKIDIEAQTINGTRYSISWNGTTASEPAATIHAITLGGDGRWLAVDTHGTSSCVVAGLSNSGQQGLFIDLATNQAYSWNYDCGQTHWAIGFGGVMAQGGSPLWSSTGFNNAQSVCTSDDDRGFLLRTLGPAIDSSLKSLYCPPAPAKYSLDTHLSWLNNRDDGSVNQYPVTGASWREGVSNSFLYNDVFAVGTADAASQNKVWRFAQTWNAASGSNCSWLAWTSPTVSRSGKYLAFPSNWMGQTGKGTCSASTRVDVFVFELK